MAVGQFNALHRYFMREALAEADRAAACGEVPVGAVLVHQRILLARAHNYKETTGNPLAHAELLAIKQAADYWRDWRLSGTTLYVTLEPCSMCAGAILQARIGHVVYGAVDPKAGCAGTLYNLLTDKRFNHVVRVTSGVLQEECALRLHNFFRNLRRQRSIVHPEEEERASLT